LFLESLAFARRALHFARALDERFELMIAFLANVFEDWHGLMILTQAKTILEIILRPASWSVIDLKAIEVERVIERQLIRLSFAVD
jgi:hypothetical protein